MAGAVSAREKPLLLLDPPRLGANDSSEPIRAEEGTGPATSGPRIGDPGRNESVAALSRGSRAVTAVTIVPPVSDRDRPSPAFSSLPGAALIPAGLSLLLLLLAGLPAELEASPPGASSDPARLVEEGRDLFVGTTRLENNGPACLGCHHTSDSTLPVGGGNYARSLTTVYSRFGREATRTFAQSSPFPVMSSAYSNRPVTDAETEKLLAYLRHVSETEASTQQPSATGIHLLGGGVGGLLVILAGIALLWRRRKRGSVNEKIYRRQIQSLP